MSLLRIALAAARKTPPSRGMSGAASAQSNALLQKVIREEIEAIPPSLPSGASASVGRGAPVDEDVRPLNLLMGVDPERAARREAGTATDVDMALWNDLPDYVKANTVGGLDTEESARASVEATLFRDPVAEGLSGPLAFRSEVEGGAGGVGEGLGGTVQGAGKYVSMGDAFIRAYKELIGYFAERKGGKLINTKFSMDFNPETIADWDAYMVDQPELVKRQMYGIMKALDQFKDWQPNRVYPRKFYAPPTESLYPMSGDPADLEKLLSEAKIRNAEKYNLKSGEEVLTFEGLSKNGQDYINVDLVIPDFRPKWNSKLGGFDIGAYYGEDNIKAYKEWADRDFVLTIEKFGFDERNTLNTPATRSQWAAEISDQMDGIVNADEAYERLIRPDPYDELTNIDLNYDVDMTDLFGPPTTEKNLNDMKTMYFSDVYRIIQDTLEKTLKTESDWSLMSRGNPNMSSAAGLDAEMDVFAGDEDAIKAMIARLAPEETTAIFKRFGLTGHKFLSESLFIDTERANRNFLFENNAWKHGGGGQAEDTLYNIASDRLKYATAEARAIIADKQRAQAYMMGVIYDDKLLTNIESAVIDFKDSVLTPEEVSAFTHALDQETF